MLVRQSAAKIVASFMAVVFLAIAFGLFPDSAWAASYPENENLSSEEVADRFALIDSSYEVGEAFSEVDADFVLRYGKKPTNGEVYRASQNFNVSGSGYGTSINATGSLYHNGVAPSYSYGGNVNINTTSGPTPKNLKLTIHCTSYGIIGSGGVGIIYNDEVSASRAWSSSFSAAPSRSYSGYMVSYSVYGWVDVTTSSGNFFTVR